MACAVWKYPVPITDELTLNLPAGARILSLQAQRGQVVLWALVNPDKRETPRRFRLTGTGHPMEIEPARLTHLGTVQLQVGYLIYHLFEVDAP